MMYLLTSLILLAIFFANRIPSKFYPYIVFLLALGLVYSTTLLGSTVVGSDIQREIVISRNALEGTWDITGTENQSGTSLVLGILAPVLSKILFLDIVWIYKAVLPLFLALVPVVLYLAYKEQFNPLLALYSAIFFSIMPTYSLEIAQIAKSMIAELFLALMILLLVSKVRFKAIYIGLCLLGMVVSHYTIALAGLAYLAGVLLFRLVTFKWLRNFRTSLLVILIPLLITIPVFGLYYSKAGGGVINVVVIQVQKVFSDIVFNNASFQSTSSGVKLGPSYPTEPSSVEPIPGAGMITMSENPIVSYFQHQPRLVQMALGLDFFEVSIWGKIFRVLQLLIQFFILLGTFLVLVTKNNFCAEFKGGIVASIVLLGCCILIEQFSAIINMTRFYHLALFFLAPCFIYPFSKYLIVGETSK